MFRQIKLLVVVVVVVVVVHVDFNNSSLRSKLKTTR